MYRHYCGALLTRSLGSVAVRIQDITFHNEVNEQGDWFSMTVYFHGAD